MPFAPEEIENKDFLITIRGYDKDEVRAFLSAISSDYSVALEAAEKARKATDNVYESFGTEVGHLLQNAKDTADQLRKQGEEEAAELRRRAEQEATALRDAATSSAKRLTQEAEQRAAELRATAESETTELRTSADSYAADTRSSAEAHAEKVRTSADRYAVEVRSAAERDAAARLRDATERVDRLRSTEMKLRQRLATVEKVLSSLREEYESDESSSTDKSSQLGQMKVEKGQADNGSTTSVKR